MQRFTSFRRNMSERTTHNELQKNDDDEPQFEGVIFHDGKCVIHWCTAVKSISAFDTFEDMITIHGHPEYGTEIIFHDGPVPAAWLDAVATYKRSEHSMSRVRAFEAAVDPRLLNGEVDGR
jgi:quinolinate synthase